jgi:hypothetical protein
MQEPRDVRDRIARSIESIAVLAREREDPFASERLSSLEARLHDDRLRVAVLGEFKRGKSTLINALLGGDVLPAGSLPLTSVTTAIQFGSTPEATIELAEEERRHVTLAELSGFVTQPENPDNRLGVRSATLSHPSPLLSEGIVLLDTPGVGSIHTENTLATKRMLPDVDVAIFVTGVDPPVSASERDFLHDVAGYANRFFFVVNKIDQVPRDEVDGVLAFTNRVISEAVGRDIDLYPMSALGALECRAGRRPDPDAGFGEFERALWAFLVRERGEVLTTSLIAKALVVAGELRAGIQIERRALDASAEDVEVWIRELGDIRDEAQRFARDLVPLLRREVAAILSILQEDVDRFATDETPALIAEAETVVANAPDLRADRGVVQRPVVERLRADVDLWRAAEDERLAQLFDEATERFVGSANEEADRVRRGAARVLSVELPVVDRLRALQGRDRFTFSTLEAPTIVESLVPDVSRLLPASGVARRSLAKARRAVPDLVDKHRGRLRYALATRIEAAGRVLEHRLREHVDATVETLGAALERAAAERRRSTSEVAARREHLEEIDSESSRLARELSAAGSSREGASR